MSSEALDPSKHQVATTNENPDVVGFRPDDPNPVAVISITLFRILSKFGGRNATILENNIVQTAGSAGESIAFGVGVTMPAIMILGFDLEITRVMLVAILGGLLGFLYQAAHRAFYTWKEAPDKVFGPPFNKGSVGIEVNPALLGVGYIIGPRIASIMCAGGVLAYLVLIPTIAYFGGGETTGAIPPGTDPI